MVGDGFVARDVTIDQAAIDRLAAFLHSEGSAPERPYDEMDVAMKEQWQQKALQYVRTLEGSIA